MLDQHRLRLAREVLRVRTLEDIRARSLANLARWEAAGSWGAAYQAWRAMLLDPDDEPIIRAMTGDDQRSIQLRLSMPYTGVLPRATVEAFNVIAAQELEALQCPASRFDFEAARAVDRITSQDEDPGVAQSIAHRFPGTHARTLAVRHHLETAIHAFLRSGRADPQFLAALDSTDDQRFWSRVSEALVAQRLETKVFGESARRGEGPDFLLIHQGQRIWVEVVCPEPAGVPREWLEPQVGVAHTLPHRELLLRWTAAIHSKARRLFADAENGREGYLDKGLVGTNDAYVIAVNGCRLRSGPFSALDGISTFPFAAEAVFPFGPYEVKIDRESLAVVDRGHQHRPYITKTNGANVPTAMFLDPQYRAVSAIWALDLNGGSACGNSEPAVVVHNPLAVNPLPVGYLPADADYVATDQGDHYELSKVPSSRKDGP